MYTLGIDAGGSHCRSRLTDGNGKVLGEGAAGPANARLGQEEVRSAVLNATSRALVSADLDAAILPETSAGIGMAGLSRRGVRRSLLEADWPFAAIRLDTDASIANRGAHGGEDGAILILGTGSIAYVQVAGETFTMGGYGFPISDEASGAALGLSAMRHALRALDGRTRPTPLSAAVTVEFDHDTAKAVSWMDDASPTDYGRFAPLVMQYAEDGDEIALSIVQHAVRHVERFIETIFEKGAPRCALMGGLAPRLRPWLQVRTAMRLVEPQGDALDGALLLARSSTQQPMARDRAAKDKTA